MASHLLRRSVQLGRSTVQRLGKAVTPTLQRSTAHGLTPVAVKSLTTSLQQTRGYAVKAKPKDDAMFCYQCEQTKNRKGCVEIGVCGKTPQVAALQDLLIHVVKGMAVYASNARQAGAHVDPEIYDFAFSSMFSTLTNVNFDPDRFPGYIQTALKYREDLKTLYENTCKQKGETPLILNYSQTSWTANPDMLNNIEFLEAEGEKFGVPNELAEYGADVHGVRQMTIYGIKGMSTYARHARTVGEWDDKIGEFVMDALSFLVSGADAEQRDLVTNLGWALKVGEWNLRGMELLDKGHTTRFGMPTPNSVSTNPKPGKCILVSGHDMNDIELILKATEGTGINVYTHGEMLPAHGYPGLQKYKHLAGHYGGAWQLQKYEFPAFPGPIVVTTNCIVEPMKSYKDRLYTMNDVGWPGCQHIDLHLPGGVDVVLKKANELGGFKEEDCKKEEASIMTGFGHGTILSHADTVIEAVKSGQLKRVFVIGGCDGAENKRSYFTTLADSLSEETLILTLGCAKFRFNRHEFGTLGDTGIPRLLDLGQCNDAYGAVVVAQALADAFDTDINSLPLSIALSWFEQKAVAVLLTMLHLGVKNIRVGPVLPAFLTPAVVDILVDKFNVVPCDIRHPKEDLEIMMAGN